MAKLIQVSRRPSDGGLDIDINVPVIPFWVVAGALLTWLVLHLFWGVS